MKSIPEAKIDLHLKLGRHLAQFVRIGEYFEDRTFDWLRLEKEGELYRATLVRSFDQGDEGFAEVLDFETANELDEMENLSCEGSKSVVFAWIREVMGLDLDGFHPVGELKKLYLEKVHGIH